MNLLITGGCGFLGSNLASHGIEQGFTVTILDNLSRAGSIQNLEWLQSLGDFSFIHGDIRNKNDVERLIQRIKPHAVFHLAGQVAMTTSIDDPYKDFEINALGTLNLLDSIRKYSPEAIIFYSSTNKVYGDLEQFEYYETDTRYKCDQFPSGFPETIGLEFHSPYGCSKGSADQYILDYNRIFGLNTTVFRHSSMYGSRQFATYDQGWVGWFCQKAVEKYQNPGCEPFTISGNGKQVRDILHADDMIQLYYTALQNHQKVRGKAYNIGGSMPQSLSLLELFAMLEKILNVQLEYTKLPVRESDQKIFVADVGKINNDIGWQPQVTSLAGIEKMVKWVQKLVKN